MSLHHYVAEYPVMWPTPHGMSKDGKSNGPSGNELGRAVNRSLWPTPCAKSEKGGPKGIVGGTGSREMLRAKGIPEEEITQMSGGSLNPDWVEWLMGWPIGWTSMEPLDASPFDEWQGDGWWEVEPEIPRVATGIKDRVNRLKCLGNGQVPGAMVLAWAILVEGCIADGVVSGNFPVKKPLPAFDNR